MKLLREQTALVVLFCVLFTGINGCQKSLDELVKTLGNAIALLVQVSGDAHLAAKIRADTDSAVALIKVWHEGQNPTDIIRALNVLIDDIQTLPVPEQYKPLVTLALGTLANIIDKLNSRSSGKEQPHTSVRITRPPENAKEFRANWDAVRASSPNLQNAPVI